MIDFQNIPLIGKQAYEQTNICGVVKATPNDFKVIEALSFEPCGEGEHIYCYVQKNNMDTERVAKQLAQFGQVPIKQVSYAGLKDKHAITEQWFSIHLPGKHTPDFLSIADPSFKVLKQQRHIKKLQRGALIGNHFEICLRDISGNIDIIAERIEQLRQGFPNYFGLQRFGREGYNLTRAQALFFEQQKIKNRHLKSLIYSATRSWLFNRYLATRVNNKTWNTLIKGDLATLSGTNSIFKCDELTDELLQRVKAKDICASGLLWGKTSSTQFQSLAEQFKAQLDIAPTWFEALERHDLQMATRPLICWPKNLHYQLREQNLLLSFFLPKGSYATVLIREICD